MKEQNNTRLIILSLSLFLIFLTSNTVSGQEIKVPCEVPGGWCEVYGVTVPPGSVANSKTFDVPNLGRFYFYATINTKFDTVGRSTYRVRLMRGTPSANLSTASGTEVVSKEITVGTNGGETLDLDVNIDSCSKTGKHYVRFENISRENPQLGSGGVYFWANPLDKRPLNMEGTTVSLDPGNESIRTIGAINKTGKLELKAKWHVPGLIPTYAKLKISVLRPDGSVFSAAKEYWSYHYQEGNPKFKVTLQITGADVGLTGSWKIKILNNSAHRIEGFNIQKEGDLNPFVPEFKSIFTNACGQ